MPGAGLAELALSVRQRNRSVRRPRPRGRRVPARARHPIAATIQAPAPAPALRALAGRSRLTIRRLPQVAQEGLVSGLMHRAAQI